MADEDVAERVFVYKITCAVNGKSYIGITSKTVKKRFSEHCAASASKKGSKTNLQHAIAAHGACNFSTYTLYEAVNILEARKVERALISDHNTLRPNGYNLTNGGDGSTKGFKVAPEVVALNRQRNTGKIMPEETKRKISAALKGRPKTPEHIENARLARGNITPSIETRAKISATLKQKYETDENYRTAMKKTSDKTSELRSRLKKELWATPEFRNKMEKYRAAPWLRTPEVVNKMGEAKRKQWADPIYRARFIAARNASSKVQEYRLRTAEKNRSSEAISI